MSESEETYDPEQFQVPAGFPEILSAFLTEVVRIHPSDIPQFSAIYFDKKSQGELEFNAWLEEIYKEEKLEYVPVRRQDKEVEFVSNSDNDYFDAMSDNRKRKH